MKPKVDSKAPLPVVLEQIERGMIESAIRRARFNRTKAARTLGVTYRALRYRIERLGIDPDTL